MLRLTPIVSTAPPWKGDAHRAPLSLMGETCETVAGISGPCRAGALESGAQSFAERRQRFE